MAKNPTRSIRVNLTRREGIEVVRALELIMQEDDACGVNMGADSVEAKNSALAKLERSLKIIAPNKRLAAILEGTPSVDVRDIRPKPVAEKGRDG